MRVLLLHPPQQAWYGPHLGLPSLAAFLRMHGVDVRVRDLNQEVNRTLLTPEWLERAAARARERFGGLAALPEPVEEALQTLPRVQEELPRALATLKDPGSLHDDAALQAAFAVLGHAYGVLSAGWHPTVLSDGLHLSGSVCSAADLAAAVADEATNPFIEVLRDTVLPALLAEEPDLVGIGLTYEDQLVPALTLARLLRAARPGLPLVAGGALVSRLLPAFRRRGELFPELDWAIVHEGETALLRLCESLAAGRPPDAGLPNLLCRAPGGGLVLGPALEEDLRTLPTPDFTDLALDRYLLAEPVLPLLTSRGCYWGRCAFCAHHQSYGEAARFRLRPAERLRADLDTLSRRHGPCTLYLVDEAVPLRSLKVVAEHEQARRLGLRWFGDVRMERGLTAGLLRALHQGGCRLLIFGQESGSQAILDRMRKGITLEQASRILHDATAAGIATVVMYFVGFPGETVQTAQQTAGFIAEHAEQITAWGVGSFSLLQGAPAHRDPTAFGITWIAPEPEDGDLGHRHAYRVLRGLDGDSASRIAASLRRRMSEHSRHSLGFPRELLALRAR